ncbi:hypothetical protein SARC_02159 [Sphaeroforma arctica JP610]|uniref:Uncharacterized protein n=1 Tax=Sphaeroforma arctica JP610 TaxID=667725 RepID=A0A0L0G9K1_9EUKA|nr:hypothetical protein SARC_02159 [Sphaeroforma arctica JP610]KNC85675.1 hypothetical protein SARC_02159 [Sphaeroforma arctica JP610]|eukprot:XP_014159577.1 hypothetical protein SARC_02159 [Sphaeroforma arctica JP610]
MTVPNANQPLLNDTNSVFITSDTSDSMPALLPNSSSASEYEMTEGTVRTEGHASRVSQHNRRLRTHVHRQVGMLNKRVERLEDIEINSLETPRTIKMDNTIENCNRENVVLEQENENPTFTSTWTLRTMPRQEERTTSWEPIPERESIRTNGRTVDGSRRS